MNKTTFGNSPLNISLFNSGSIAAGGLLYGKFTTRNTSGVPTTLAGSPVISVYKDASTTQSTAGVTLIVDFDGVTGLNHVAIDTSADATFYANGSHFELVITTGTVGGTSVVGEDVGSFDLAAASGGSAPTAAEIWTYTDRTLTALPPIPANWLTAAGITAGALNGKGDWLTTLGATAPVGWINAGAIAADALNGKGNWLLTTDTRLNNLDATISSRSTYAGGPVTSVSAPIILPSIPASWITAAGIAAGALNGKGDWSTLTDAQAADKLLGRNIAGGADGGRTVAQAMAFLRNKWEIVAGTLIVYAANDSTSLWTATVTTTAGNPVTGIDPA